MAGSEVKIIKLSKTKSLRLIFGSFAFVAMGLWLISLDAAQIEAMPRYHDPLFVHSIGWV